MKKISKIITVLSCLMLVGFGCESDVPEDLNVDYEEDVYPLIAESTTSTAVRGSCNIIDTASHCEDYIGSMWGIQDMQLQCEGVGTWSEYTCPYSENGGCRVGKGTIMETVLWSYPYGGEPITGENVQYEAMACSVNPLAEWIMPEDLLEQ